MATVVRGRRPVERAIAAPMGLLLAAVLAVGAILRLSTLDAQSLWLDEAFTAELVELPFAQMLERIRLTESTPPLFYALLWGWTQLAGTGEVALRLPSALAGVATVPAAWAAGRALVSPRAGAAAAALVAVHPWLVWYAQEARAYALAVLLVTVALACLPGAVAGRRRALLGFTLAAGVALWTHYFTSFLVAPAALWLVVAARGRRDVLVAGAVLVAVQLAVLPWALAGVENRGAAGISSADGGSRLVTAAKQVAGGEFGSPVDALTAAAALLLCVGAVLAVLRTGRAERRGALLAGSLAACTLLVPLAAARAGFDYLLPRYLVVGLVPLLVAVAAGFAAPRAARVGLPALAALLVLHGGLSVAAASTDAMQRDDWRAAARALGPVPEGGRAVVLTPPFSQPLARYGQPMRPPSATSATVREVAVVGVGRDRDRVATPAPPPGFTVAERRDAASWSLVRYRARAPASVVLAQLAPLGLDGGAAVLLQPRP
jgi:4-amino-4-deoxy-L-arabinose transferase-like glycosyltransferase